MTASEVLKPFIESLNLGKVRIGPSQRFIFFCGGRLSDPPTRPASVRDYLRRRISGRAQIANASFVFAESATKLFRDSGYSDLIQFEADIAQISDLVLLVAESAGSLTELGAFAMDGRAPRLLVFIRDDYYQAESFIRLGPLRFIHARYDDAVSYYPWRSYNDGSLKVTTISSYIRDIKRDIIAKLDSLPKAEELNIGQPRHIMILIFWCLYVLRGATLNELVECLSLFQINRDEVDVRKYLYCMTVAGWVGETQYGHTVWPAPGLDDTQLGESSLPLELHRAQIPDRRVPSL